MITLTRFSGSVFALNSDLIERVDSTPDTVITLVDGTKYLVSEGLQEVVAAIRAYRGAVIAESARLSDMPETPPAQAVSHPSLGGPRRLVPVPSPASAAEES